MTHPLFSLIDITLALLILWGYKNEDKLIAFEGKIAERFKRSK